MPSKVQIVKEIRSGFEQDPGRREGERMFDDRAHRFEQVFADRGPGAAVEADRTMAEYFGNWWVGPAYADKGVPLRKALKAANAQPTTGAVLVETDGANVDGSPVTAEQVAAEDAAYQETLDQLEQMQRAVDDVTGEYPTIGSDGELVQAPTPVDVPLTQSQEAEIADMEAAYQYAEAVEAGEVPVPRKMSPAEQDEALRLLELFAASVHGHGESTSRRVSRRVADLQKSIAKRS